MTVTDDIECRQHLNISNTAIFNVKKKIMY